MWFDSRIYIRVKLRIRSELLSVVSILFQTQNLSTYVASSLQLACREFRWCSCSSFYADTDCWHYLRWIGHPARQPQPDQMRLTIFSRFISAHVRSVWLQWYDVPIWIDCYDDLWASSNTRIYGCSSNLVFVQVAAHNGSSKSLFHTRQLYF